MKIAFFDCQFGAAGDMLLGALIDSGLSFDGWHKELKKIALPKDSFKISVQQVVRCTIASKKIIVHEGEHDHGSFSDHHRNLTEIIEIIDRSKISNSAKNLATRIFKNLGQAESKVHGVPIDQVHFHEVGAIDALVDIIGFAIAYDMLAIQTSYVSPLPLGSGTVTTAHGTFPVPAPAVPIMLANAGARISGAKVSHECLTPTGAAILSTIASEWSDFPPMKNVSGIGYGAGTFDPPDYPNICRVFIGESISGIHEQNGDQSGQQKFAREIICILEVNIDDLSPQILAYAVERLFEAGALDVLVIPAVMKKGRSGQLLTVICYPESKSKFEEIIFKQTTTIGIRSHLCERLVAEREWREVALNNETTVCVKIAQDLNGNIINAQPEYEDCAHYATTNDLPLKEVLNHTIARLNAENQSS